MAYLLDGTNDWIDLPDNSNMDCAFDSQDKTFLFQLHITNTDPSGTIYCLDTHDGNGMLVSFDTSLNRFTFRVSDGVDTVTAVGATSSISAIGTYQCVTTWDASANTAQIYTNGVAGTSATDTNINGTADATNGNRIGASEDDTDDLTTDGIVRAAFWNRLLTLEEIQGLLYGVSPLWSCQNLYYYNGFLDTDSTDVYLNPQPLVGSSSDESGSWTEVLMREQDGASIERAMSLGYIGNDVLHNPIISSNQTFNPTDALAISFDDNAPALIREFNPQDALAISFTDNTPAIVGGIVSQTATESFTLSSTAAIANLVEQTATESFTLTSTIALDGGFLIDTDDELNNPKVATAVKLYL